MRATAKGGSQSVAGVARSIAVSGGIAGTGARVTATRSNVASCTSSSAAEEIVMAALMSFSYFPSNEHAYGVVASSARPLVVDPVCGRMLAIDEADAHVVYRGITYYFCSDACHRRFTWQPARVAGDAR